MYNNIISTILLLLKIKHTHNFTREYFNTYPSNNTLWAIHNILVDYNIKSVALKIDDKNKIDTLDLPFIAHIANDFCVVKNISNEKITYIAENKEIKSSKEDFFKLWTGIVLLPKTTISSIEPNYKEHCKLEITSKLIKYTTIASIVAIFLLSVIFNNNDINIGWYLLLLFNILNLCVGYILLYKENNLNSKFVDKFCSTSKGQNCSSIVGKKSKLFGIISWSEMGVSYFLSNIVILLFIPNSIYVISLFSVLVLPYTFWSIWYQKYIEKRWCSLCLITQLLLWCAFIICTLFEFLSFQQQNLLEYLCALLLYPIFLFIVNKYVQTLKLRSSFNDISFQYNTLKWNEKVFVNYLDDNYIKDNSHSYSSIVLGHNDAKNIITIFSNPYCTPCAKLEDTISNILKFNSCKVQYVFTSLDDSDEKAIKILISAILNTKAEDKHIIIKEWHTKGKLNVDKFATKYNANINDINVLDEYENHIKFTNNCGVNSTPRILFNGYLVKYPYSLNDIYQIYKNN